MNYLTDKELIDYTLKFDNDPVRVRLAQVMDAMPGIILDELEHAGMDPESCTFENIYSPGQYIKHLENEIEYLNNELNDALEKLRERDTLTVSELIHELKEEAVRSNARARYAQEEKYKAEQEVEETRKRMKVWTAISTDI